LGADAVQAEGGFVDPILHQLKIAIDGLEVEAGHSSAQLERQDKCVGYLVDSIESPLVRPCPSRQCS
jgi:hypothetical protein